MRANGIVGLAAESAAFCFPAERFAMSGKVSSVVFTLLCLVLVAGHAQQPVSSPRLLLDAEGNDARQLVPMPAQALRFMREDGTECKLPVLVKANSRLTVKVNDVKEMKDVAFATMASSSEPIVVERAKYYAYGDKSGGDTALGAPAPALTWYFAEGCTR